MKWWQIQKRNADLEREMRVALELEEEEQRERGLSPEDARQAALRFFGNATLIREHTHEAWGWAPVERILQDARYAMRQLWRSPGFSLVTMLTLALGIGATTAIFTLVYDVMLRPLPFSQPDRLVTIKEKVAEWSAFGPTLPVSANHFTFWQKHNRSFDSMALLSQYSAPVGTQDHPLEMQILWATPGIFSVLGVQPALGRAFTEEEGQWGHALVAILTYDLWHKQFGGDPNILSKTVTIDGRPHAVVGVMPQSFRMPSIWSNSIGTTDHEPPIGILVPLTFSKRLLAEEMGDLNYVGLARMKPGVSIAAAGAELDELQKAIASNLPANEKATLSAQLTAFQESLVGANRKPLLILLAAVAGLLLVGCVNVANLLLSRAVGRKRQMALAAALGASRSEMIRMAIRETAMLAVLGGGLGVLLAAVILPLMQQYLPPRLDFRGGLHLDWMGVACALLLALLATLTAGVAPAFMISRTAPQEVLHSDSRLTSESRSSRRARCILVATEAAISVALVLMTGLLIASLVKLMKVDRGFSAERTMTVSVTLPGNSYSNEEKRTAFYRDVLDRMRHLPGVEHAGFVSMLPLTGEGWGSSARVEGDARPETQLPIENFRSVSSQYFEAIRLRIASGKSFDEGDWGKRVALVSEKTAKALWHGQDPIGRQFHIGDPPPDEPFTVVGVVGDARTVSLEKPDPMMVYVPYWYRCDPSASLVIRTHQEPSEMADVIRQTIWSVDRGVPVPTVRTMDGRIADSVASQRFLKNVLSLFAVSALFLAGLGVYGVLTYSVTQRYRELGLRMALGAQRANVYWLVLSDGLLPVALGAIAGIALAMGSARLVSSLLFEVSPYDPLLSASAIGLLMAVGVVACLLPARNAAAVEPMQALRTD